MEKAVNWKKSHLLLAAALLLAVGACATIPEVIKLAGKKTVAGEVTFSHGKHAGEYEEGGYGIACDRCHHSIWNERGSSPKTCRSCHRRESVEPASMEEAAHKLCIECHEELQNKDTSKKKLPTSCPDCHGGKEADEKQEG